VPGIRHPDTFQVNQKILPAAGAAGEKADILWKAVGGLLNRGLQAKEQVKSSPTTK